MGSVRDSSRLRHLRIGKMEQPSTSLRTNIPTGGVDGDIRVQASNGGPALFTKFNGEWYTAPLTKTTGGGSAAQVKIHLMTGTKTSGTTAYIALDSSIIPPGSVVGVSLFMNHSGNFWMISNWADISDDDGTGSGTQGGTNTAEFGPFVTRHRVLYEWDNHRIKIDRQGTQISGAKQYKLLVFYT